MSELKTCPQCGIEGHTELFTYAGTEMCYTCREETMADDNVNRIAELEAEVARLHTIVSAMQKPHNPPNTNKEKSTI